MSTPAASRMRTVALLIDGPMPSPGMSVTGVPIAMPCSASGGRDQVGGVCGQAGEQPGRGEVERPGRGEIEGVAPDVTDPPDVARAAVEHGEAEHREPLVRRR